MTDRELILLHDLLEDLETDEGVCFKTRSSTCATACPLWYADAYGFGPERMKKFFIALQENNDEITRMEKEVDTDYAYEKLRLKAERVTGMKIEYLYEHEAQENEA